MEEATFELSLEDEVGSSHVYISGETVPGRGNGKCKGPEGGDEFVVFDKPKEKPV